MRVLHMIGSLGIGGSQAFIMAIYRKIDRSKIQFDFIIDHPEGVHHVDEIEKLGGKVYTFKNFKGYNFISVRKEWDDFFSSHPEYKILHCHTRSYASIFIPIAKKHGLKVIIHSHSDSNGSGLVSLYKDLLQFPLRFQADYYMACSKKAGEWLFGKKICSSNKFFIAKNAIDIERFLFSKENRNKIRKQYNIEDKFVLGFLARVSTEKNPLFAIEVMKELLNYKPDSIFLFVGDGELLVKTKEKTYELGIVDKVIFTGALSNVGELLSAMDYYILPSAWEGLGISLIEAQTSGIKCICSSAIPSEAFIIDENIKKLDVDAGANAWAKEIANTDLCDRENTESVPNRIKKSGFDIENNSKYFSDFYSQLVSKE